MTTVHKLTNTADGTAPAGKEGKKEKDKGPFDSWMAGSGHYFENRECG
jgi:hypothetical protein